MAILVGMDKSSYTSHPGPNLRETARSSRLVERKELGRLNFGVGRSFCIIDCKLQK